ncbi:hypothetical protein GCM10027020_38150 [Nocardioides salsibiostraticola]
MTSIRRTSVVVAALTVTLGLSGCAVTGTNFQPGVAGEVGDRTVTTENVNTVTTDFCAAFVASGQTEGQQFPLGLVRRSIATQLVLKAAAEQLAEDFGIEAGPEYQQALSELTDATSDLTEDQQAAVLEFQGGDVYVTSIQAGVGARLLADEGQPTDDPEAAFLRGQEALFEVLRTQGEINPVYDITITDLGQPEPGGADVSVPVGDRALSGGLEQPDPAYVASLPESQRCG